MTVRLPGRRRLRSPKIVLRPRVEAESPVEVEVEGNGATDDTEAIQDSIDAVVEDDNGLEWSPRMRKSELAEIARKLGVDIDTEMSKSDIVKELEKLS